jgi:hypothetical protein
MNKINELFEKHGIVASDAQTEDFEKWLVKTMWSNYNDEKMNLRIVIENKIKSLGLRFSNGTVGKEFSAQLSIPNDLIDDAWIEGLENLGLTCTIKEDEVEPQSEEQTEDSTVPNDNITIESVSSEFIDTCEVNKVEEKKETKPENLQAVDTTLIITGKPTTPGDFTVTLYYKHRGWCGDLPIKRNSAC